MAKITATCGHEISPEQDVGCWFDMGDGLSWGVLCPSCRAKYEVKPKEKRGLQEFIKLYDMLYNAGSLALDLAQNLSFRYEFAEDKTVKENDVRLAYGVVNSGLMDALHKLAKSLGYTREDYIVGANKRRGKGNVNVYIVGEGSINMDAEELFKEDEK